MGGAARPPRRPDRLHARPRTPHRDQRHQHPGDANSVFSIFGPGSYYLTGNVVGAAGKRGIEIHASNVSIDLNGFSLVGQPGSLDGVAIDITGLENVQVRNGFARDWGENGVDIAGTVGGLVQGVSTHANGFAGIHAANGTVVVDCASYANTGAGIDAAFGCVVTRCCAYFNAGNGIESSAGTTISGCAAYLNANGINVTTGCTVTACAASNNTAIGINTGNGCTIANNTARSNGTDGIRVAGGCLVLANTSGNNGADAAGGAGIAATGTDNRIEGNVCCTQDRGIEVTVAGNLIIRNTCSGNTTNWSIAAGNACLVVMAITGGAAISGNTGGAAVGSTDPYVNFTY